MSDAFDCRRFDEAQSEVTMSETGGAKFTAFDTDSIDEVGLRADQLGNQLACTQVWGGNNIADELVNLPGLVGLSHAKARGTGDNIGDVHGGKLVLTNRPVA
jgi:hypothetical protein